MLTESALRKKAHKIGYHVLKGFQHFRGYVFYDCNDERTTGYMVQNLYTGLMEWDGYDENFDFLWTLQDVEDFLKEQYKALGLQW